MQKLEIFFASKSIKMSKYLELINGIDSLQYGSSTMHRFLSKDDNIGFLSENLTIIILSCNRAKATIKLVDSIESTCRSFHGEILIADNGSTQETLEIIKEKINTTSLNCKLIEFKTNYGVAGGRNKAIEYVNTKWIMFLDNDIYFINDIFPEIQRDIGQIGCKFINLPLLNYDKKTLFTYGGHIYLDILNNDTIHVGCGSSFKQINIENLTFNEMCLATFLFGGCAVLEKESFLSCGKFDEGMFIGFEDLDFSITLFNKGLKIGCCRAIGLVHDHVKSENADDIEYERKRFSNKALYESALYFRNKHNLEVWSTNTEKWLAQREKELGIQSYKMEREVPKTTRKAKIALVVDTRNWAYDNIATNICKYLHNEYDFKIIYISEIPDGNIAYIFYACLDCDIIHFFWRGAINYLYGDYAKYYLNYYGRGVGSFKEEVIRDKIITCSIYDHKYLNSGIQITKNILSNVKAYTVSSRKLFDVYSKLNIKKPEVEITDGVDLNVFYPTNMERFNDLKERKIIFGWVGNSQWNGNSKNDYKGLNTIIKPVIEELKDEGYNVDLEFTDKQSSFIPHKEMVNYYSKIDLYLCASLAEGTPNPVLEAMACGVPIISTDVGIVQEVFGEKQKRYVLEERTKKCLKDKIKLFINDLDSIKEISNENLLQIKKWSWKNKSEEFNDFFKRLLKDSKIGE